MTDANKKSEDEDNLARLGDSDGATFVASFNARTRVRPGDTIDVLVDTTHMHFFDIETGERL